MTEPLMTKIEDGTTLPLTPSAETETDDRQTVITPAKSGETVAINTKGDPSSTRKHVYRSPVLTFSVRAWAKLLYIRDLGDTEIGAFGICKDVDEPLYVHDIYLPKQECSRAYVEFDDDSLLDWSDKLLDEGLQPFQYSRIWIHTHPQMAPDPSSVDEATFARIFEHSSWGVMCIVNTNNEYYARLWCNSNPGLQSLIPLEVDYAEEFEAADHAGWYQEYYDAVTPMRYQASAYSYKANHQVAPGYKIPSHYDSTPSDLHTFGNPYADGYDDDYWRTGASTYEPSHIPTPSAMPRATEEWTETDRPIWSELIASEALSDDKFDIDSKEYKAIRGYLEEVMPNDRGWEEYANDYEIDYLYNVSDRYAAAAEYFRGKLEKLADALQDESDEWLDDALAADHEHRFDSGHPSDSVESAVGHSAHSMSDEEWNASQRNLRN